AIAGLEVPLLRALLPVLPGIAGIPGERESQLARLLAGHPDEEVRAWASPGAPAPPPMPVVPGGKNLPACLALLARTDPPDKVAEAFARACPNDVAFVRTLDAEMVRLHRTSASLPFLGRAWMYRWDNHQKVFAEPFEKDARKLPPWLRWANTQ